MLSLVIITGIQRMDVQVYVSSIQWNRVSGLEANLETLTVGIR